MFNFKKLHFCSYLVRKAHIWPRLTTHDHDWLSFTTTRLHAHDSRLQEQVPRLTTTIDQDPLINIPDIPGKWQSCVRAFRTEIKDETSNQIDNLAAPGRNLGFYIFRCFARFGLQKISPPACPARQIWVFLTKCKQNCNFFKFSMSSKSRNVIFPEKKGPTLKLSHPDRQNIAFKHILSQSWVIPTQNRWKTNTNRQKS